jgi:hypothetical protein
MADDSTATEATPKAGSSSAKGSKGDPKSCLLVAFLGAGVGMLGIYLALRPDGEPMGDVDLLDRKSTVAVDGKTGDSLTFVGTITTGLGAYSGSSKNKANAATSAMEHSTLTVVVTGPDGREENSSCSLWEGSMGTDRDDHELTENNVINDCKIVLAADGKHTVAASVRWEHNLAIRRAKLTVYNDRP